MHHYINNDIFYCVTEVFCTDLRRQSSMSSVTLSVSSAGAPVSPVAASMPTVRPATSSDDGTLLPHSSPHMELFCSFIICSLC
jgi:hypothetical protein